MPLSLYRIRAQISSSVCAESADKHVDKEVIDDLRRSLERTEKELQVAKERKASLERECVIYQSQLDVSISNNYMYHTNVQCIQLL